MEAFIDKYGDKIESLCEEISRERCEGCQNDYENQLGHECVMMSSEEKLIFYFAEAFSRLSKPEMVHDIKQALLHILTGEAIIAEQGAQSEESTVTSTSQ